MATLQRAKCKDKQCRHPTFQSAAQLLPRTQSVQLRLVSTSTHTKLRRGKSRVPSGLYKTWQRLPLLRRTTSPSMCRTARMLEIERAAPAARVVTAAPLLDVKVISLNQARWAFRVERIPSKRNEHLKHLVALLYSHSLAS